MSYTTESRESEAENAGIRPMVVIAWIVAVVTLLYMLPWAVAVTRDRANQNEIGIVNLLLGWTIVGWVASLLFALRSGLSRNDVARSNAGDMSYAVASVRANSTGSHIGMG